jgi:toluene monooxygenase system protein A
MDVGGILGYMGLTPDVMGDDPDYEAWTKDYAGRPAEGLAPAAAAQS